ncbi:MAG: DUF2782 domain-containing protein [Oceanospirillales bacterium]|uniref:Uncharacterized protein DUF2782 n=1 Tax=Marinobacterium halophilum TaxID=267374 RepID=A0A2P8EVW1_9GAMM|nr:DUF2782 domain-containing protein [Marinobacterium halophilum]MBR9828846.1 DUF2782 domain-containing protein [Oceanospirillales bacterium]PSL13606.1 uncharacterized protein DUF2782 [Marinobacterium halophilum]
MLKKLTLAAILALSPLAQAEVVDDPALTEPEITITHDGDSTYYEYTINGQLKEIKVVPKVGKPYYLVPADGSQKFIRVEESQLLIPKWVIFRW